MGCKGFPGPICGRRRNVSLNEQELKDLVPQVGLRSKARRLQETLKVMNRLISLQISDLVY